jgi:uncharacterized protein (DUF58 family)
MTLSTSTDVRNFRLPVITGRLVALVAVAAIVVGVLGAFGIWIAVLAVNAVIVAAAAYDWLMAPKPSKVEVVREMPDAVVMGDEATVVWHISNPEDSASVILVADEFVNSLSAGNRRAGGRVPGRGRISKVTSIVPQRRGKFAIASMTVRTHGPLGLAGRQGRRRDEHILKVMPRFDSRREVEMRINRARLADSGLRTVRMHGGGTEFEQLREYTVDDDHRRIDWFATARQSKPIVRTYRAEQNQNVQVLLDCGRLMAGKVSDIPRFEHGLDATLAISTIASRLGDRVGFMSFDESVGARVPLSQGNSHLARIRNSMYELEPKLVESNFRRAFVEMTGTRRRRSFVVVITDIAESAIGESLLPSLTLLSRNHLVVVAAVTDPDVATWSRQIPTEVDKAFRKAAAVDSLASRQRARAKIRATGAQVIDARPGEFVSKLADAYFDAKSTGRL